LSYHSSYSGSPASTSDSAEFPGLAPGLEDQGLIQLEEIPAGDSGEITYRVSQP